MRLRGLMEFSAAALTAALALTGCTHPADIDEVKKPEGIGLIHGTELRSVMLDINTVMYDQHLSELEREDERRRYALRLADRIDALSGAIAQVPQKSDKIKLDNAQMERYLSYVKELRRKGAEVRNVAKNYEMEKLRPALNDVVATCNKCHDDFRDVR